MSSTKNLPPNWSLLSRSLANSSLYFFKNSFACLFPVDLYRHLLDWPCIHTLMGLLICDLVPAPTNDLDLPKSSAELIALSVAWLSEKIAGSSRSRFVI